MVSESMAKRGELCNLAGILNTEGFLRGINHLPPSGLLEPPSRINLLLLSMYKEVEARG
jgi:hypothetical protein